MHRCQSCGVGLQMARRQSVCSWCKGDPDYGKDGYFNDIIDDPFAPWHGLPRATIIDLLKQDKRGLLVP